MAKIALAAIREEATIVELSSHYEVHRTQIGIWRKRPLEVPPDIFRGKPDKSLKDKDKFIEEQYHQIEQLKVKNE